MVIDSFSRVFDVFQWFSRLSKVWLLSFFLGNEGFSGILKAFQHFSRFFEVSPGFSRFFSGGLRYLQVSLMVFLGFHRLSGVSVEICLKLDATRYNPTNSDTTWCNLVQLDTS
jgi:hypothetical protein